MKKRKKILFYTMILTKGGAEQTIVNLANYFINLYDITIVTNINCSSEYKLDDKINIIYIDKNNKRYEKLPRKIFTKINNFRTKELKKIIEYIKPDLVITFLPEPTIRMLSIKKYFSIPVITAIRNNPKKELFYPFFNIFRDYYYKKANMIIIQDESYMKYLNSKYYSNISVIPNFITKEFMIDNKLSCTEDKIVTVSRLNKQKNIKLLINSFAKLDYSFNKYKLYIYGNGSEKKKLNKLILKKHLEDRVFILENVDNVCEKIVTASLFVLTSNYEGMPNVILEAMSLSLPVISTNCTPVINNIIDNNVNGIIISKNNSKKLVSSIEYLLSNSKISKEMGREASKIKTIYNKEKVIKFWEKVINKNIK